jgi:hypothetical protein
MAIRRQQMEEETAGKLVSKKEHTSDGSELKQKVSTLARQGSSETEISTENCHKSQYASNDNSKSENEDDTPSAVVQSSATITLLDDPFLDPILGPFLDPFFDIHYNLMP